MAKAIGLFLAILGAVAAIQILISLLDRRNRRIKRQKSITRANDLLRSHFDPILVPCGYQAGLNFEIDYKCVVPYENPERGLKVEFAWATGGSGWFHMVFSKMNAEGHVVYSDGLNSLGMHDLGGLMPDHHHKQLAPLDTKSEDLLAKAVRLIEQHSRFFTSTPIPNADLITQVRTYAIEMGYDPTTINPDHRNELHAALREKITPIMTERSFELTCDTTELPAYDSDHMTPRLIFKRKRSIIEVGRYDWRDNPYLQIIRIDGREVFSVDVSKRGQEGAVDDLTREMKNRMNGN